MRALFLVILSIVITSTCMLTSKSASAQESAAQYRVWTDVTGKFSVEASFVKMETGQVSLKRKDNDEIITVPAARMSQSDLVIARRLSRELERASSQPKAESASLTEPSAAEGEQKKKAWTGNWNNRKFGTNGPVTCIAELENETTWKASFVGTGIGKPFKYEVKIKATPKGNQIQLAGESQIDGDAYTWNGYVRGNVLYGRYRSASGNNGEFQLKETKVPTTTQPQQPDRRPLRR